MRFLKFKLTTDTCGQKTELLFLSARSSNAHFYVHTSQVICCKVNIMFTEVRTLFEIKLASVCYLWEKSDPTENRKNRIQAYRCTHCERTKCQYAHQEMF